jgi:transcriptional regulator with XRE-family HTH domain
MTGECDTPPGAFGAWLKAEREARNMTLRDVERATGGRVTNPGLSQIETGHIQNPSLFTCVCLAAVYGLSGSEMFERAKVGEGAEPARRCAACGQVIG